MRISKIKTSRRTFIYKSDSTLTVDKDYRRQKDPKDNLLTRTINFDEINILSGDFDTTTNTAIEISRGVAILEITSHRDEILMQTPYDLHIFTKLFLSPLVCLKDRDFHLDTYQSEGLDHCIWAHIRSARSDPDGILTENGNYFDWQEKYDERDRQSLGSDDEWRKHV